MYKIIVFALISAILIIYLKSINPELAILASICSGIIILTFLIGYLSDTFILLKKLVELSNIDNDLYKIIIKVTLIGYIFEFSAGIIEDFGLKNISDKLILVAKVIILSLSLPIFYSLINVITSLIK